MSIKTSSNVITSSNTHNVDTNVIVRHASKEDDISRIFNNKFYVNVLESEDIMKKAATFLANNGYVCAIPVMSDDDRDYHETCIMLVRTDDFIKNIEQFENILNEATENNGAGVSNITKGVITELTSVFEDYSDPEYEKDAYYIFINVKDSVYNQHRCIVSVNDINNNLFEACVNKVTASKTDYQLNFGSKVTGNIGASFGECPIAFGKYLGIQIPGGTSTLNLESYKLAYLGSIFTNELFEDYSQFRFALDIEFKPLNSKFATNTESFEYYHNMIDQTKEKNPSKLFSDRSKSKLNCKLANIKLSVSGKLVTCEQDVEDVVRSLIDTICVAGELKNSDEICVKVIERVRTQIKHENLDYDLSLNLEDIFSDIEFFITTW